MARQLVGIRQNTTQVMISGARVAFDPRTTAEVATSRDEKNYKAAEEYQRKNLWESRQHSRHREAAE